MDITVVIPVYNGKKYLEKCVESLQMNNYNDYELLLIDDGSTDGTSELCDTLASKDNHIKVFHLKNAGCSAARNFGVQRAEGKYILFVDQDDYVSSNYLERVALSINKNPDMILFQWERVTRRDENINDSGQSIEIREYGVKDRKYLISNLLYVTDPELKSASLVFPWAKAYSKDFLLKNNLLFNSDVKICEDVWFNISCLKKSTKVLFDTSRVYCYYDNPKSQGSSYNKECGEIGVTANLLIEELLGDLLNENEIKIANAYSHIYRYWWCVVADFYNVDNHDTIFQRAKRMKQLSQKQGYRDKWKYLDKNMLKNMDTNMRLVMKQIKNKNFLVASFLCKCRIVLKKLRMGVN